MFHEMFKKGTIFFEMNPVKFKKHSLVRPK